MPTPLLIWKVYGVDESRFGVGSRRVTYNYNTDDRGIKAEDKLPLAPNVKLEYQGELAASMYISIVVDSLMDPDGAGPLVGNPCAYPFVATAAANSAGTTNARLQSGVIIAVGKVVTIPQGTGDLLDFGTFLSQRTYAVCYAEIDGTNTDTSWSDSYIRFQPSKVIVNEARILIVFIER